MNNLILSQCRLCQNDEEFQPYVISYLSNLITKKECMEKCGVGKTLLNTHVTRHIGKDIYTKIAVSDPNFVEQIKNNVIEVLDTVDNFKEILEEINQEKDTSGYDVDRIKLAISANKEILNGIEKLSGVVKALTEKKAPEPKVTFNINMEAQDFLVNDACPMCKQKAYKKLKLTGESNESTES